MTNIKRLNEKWIKSAMLGTTWASSEIILGSFLHNLRIPFSGNILTAIGLIILISASYKWTEKGLFWRAGIICALLKTMSPSAVIFGPMIAIFSEAVLLELSVRIFGRTVIAFVLGSVLAMSWNLFQKIFNFIIFYGFNIVEVYTNLMQFAEKQLRLKFDAVWAPIILLLIIYAMFGVFAAIIGIRTGKRIVNFPLSKQNFIKPNNSNYSRLQKLNGFKHSIFWLVLNVSFMVGSLLLIDRINFGVWTGIIIAIAILWAFRYKRALRQLLRPGLWILFVIITMVTAFVFTRLQSDSTSITDAILIGVEMNLRAIILIMGFTVLGTELYNPKIREYIGKSYFKQLPLALELSLDSLPAIIANTPDVKIILRNPVMVVYHLINYAETRLNEIRNNIYIKQNIYIITGKVGSGKTTLIQTFIDKYQQNNFTVSGIYSTRMMEDKITTGYNVVNISTGKSEKFLRMNGTDQQSRIGKFFIYPEGIKMGNEALLENHEHLIIIDEIGKLELEGKGWSDSLQQLINDSKNHLLLSVREEVLHEVTEKFRIKPKVIFNVSDQNNADLFQMIFDDLQIRD